MENVNSFLVVAFFTALVVIQQSSSEDEKVQCRSHDQGLQKAGLLSYPREVPGAGGIPSRSEQLKRLQKNDHVYDVLVVGGGATGAGIALDAATRGGLQVACLERGDFASETSSRSTKLIWAGIKYMGTAVAALLSTKLIQNPPKAINDFMGEMTMVLNCHRERRYMMEKQEHLCSWLPICVPFVSWTVFPPPFKHHLYGFFPILSPLVMKFYDGLSSFSCPPSYIIGPSKMSTVFPQLRSEHLKYCSVFYEAVHNDSRTNIAIALSAADHGAHICNYVEVVDLFTDGTKRVIGAKAVDRMTGKEFTIRAKKIILAGGPFTDSLRQLEDKATATEKPAVRGAHGTHIILPGKYLPPNMGLLDYNSSDGRFLFVIPWQGRTLVGTTDRKTPAETSPKPPEEEIKWLLNECQKYIYMKGVSRQCIFGMERLASFGGGSDAAPGAPVSRDHIISENPETGVVFIAGGKWTTWREMAQDVMDRAIGQHGPKCNTLELKLFGGEGYSKDLTQHVMNKYTQLNETTAQHLVRTYGSQVWEVCKFMTMKQGSEKLVANFPYIRAEVAYACREYACTVEDVLSRRTRLAFLDRDAAMEALPVVADIMAKELKWSRSVKRRQMASAKEYVLSYGGRTPDEESS
eukprot:CAMPEP_0118703852 /NCGR_PEP_ID=MMETSP0800-20121206/18846_1 /TAXON_ID=210618 ORGANISM="Striatella unipunctata, Strain CCMP2910" /NCGR_SAMPLE_ID=MMETSP0800 /ASSEMBLY_ACC=CAM_ASM_000638 /LENGTH=633 /DNA_ID=CAMNT_0006605549 /DNA_START=117 /DNA_END=2020 /DNA_ORIENTATION=-